jgi:predicted dinucleotide-binding enzyme
MSESGAPMKLVLTLMAGCLLAPAFSRADGDDKQEVGRELGSALAWRLGPEAVEEACRSVDPDGAEARKKALKAWLEKNAALIRQVDERVAEVVPLAYPSPANVDAVQAVRGQVKKILLEPMFSGRTPQESAAICKDEADPANPRWTSNGAPQVQQALAALYDWKIQRTAK